MSERSRQRWLFVHNRLEELAAKLGPIVERDAAGADLPPSWGPVGSLLRSQSPAAYEQVLALHRGMIEQERARMPRYVSETDASRWAVVGHPLDRFGETECLACLLCGETSLKVSVPINLWRCGSCGAVGRASTLLSVFERGRPSTPARLQDKTGQAGDPLERYTRSDDD